MITGSFTPSVSEKHQPSIRVTGANASSGNLAFHEVSFAGFEGGYFLNPGLPYTSSDFIYLDTEGDFVVLLWGVMYNKPELAERCRCSMNVADPELAAILFRNEGPGFVKMVNGDFAMCIVRPATGELYLFRDHLGIRPLAYAADEQSLHFSSDITGLCSLLSGGDEINREVLLAYFKYTDLRQTPCAKVQKLLPGHYLHFSGSGVAVTKYWEPGRIGRNRGLMYKKMLSDLLALVRDAVKIRCDHRFTAGAHVTSGIDSGLVSVLARREYAAQEPFCGYSWSPLRYTPVAAAYDERKIVRQLCERERMQPVFSDLDSARFSQVVSDYYFNQGYFSEDRTTDQMAGHRTNLLFSGWGGDEFISTGDRGIELDLLRELRLGAFFRRNPVSRPYRFARDLFHYIIFPALGILGPMVAKSFRDDAFYIKRPYRRSSRRAVRDFYFHTSRRQMHLRLLHLYHLQERCENWAILGYRKSLEYRYPLLDKRIIEYMLGVPTELLCRKSCFRPLLREIGEGILPDEVRWQWEKSDPVYHEYMDMLFRETATHFIDEVEEWRENRELSFVDFDRLKTDTDAFRQRPEKVNGKVLFRALIYTKAIHEFIKTYRDRERDAGAKQNTILFNREQIVSRNQ